MNCLRKGKPLPNSPYWIYKRSFGDKAYYVAEGQMLVGEAERRKKKQESRPGWDGSLSYIRFPTKGSYLAEIRRLLVNGAHFMGSVPLAARVPQDPPSTPPASPVTAAPIFRTIGEFHQHLRSLFGSKIGFGQVRDLLTYDTEKLTRSELDAFGELVNEFFGASGTTPTNPIPTGTRKVTMRVPFLPPANPAPLWSPRDPALTLCQNSPSVPRSTATVPTVDQYLGGVLERMGRLEADLKDLRDELKQRGHIHP